MCGRYSLTPTRASIIHELNIAMVADLDHVPAICQRHNIAPTQAVAVVVHGAKGRMLTAMRWGIGSH